MLSNTSRWLTYLASVLYAILGAILFFFPEQIAPVFAWKVTGFMTMTIGGWCLGNAWLAFFAARRWVWDSVYAGLVYFWSFGILETLVLLVFRAKLQLVNPIAWLYFVTLAVNLLLAILGILEWLRLRPTTPASEPMTGFLRFLVVGFIIFVGFLGLFGLFAPLGIKGTNGEIFPEIMSAFTLRSFGAFYLSLTIGMVPLLFEKYRRPFLGYGFLAFGLIVIITVAAVVYLRLFNFHDHPFGTAYFLAYIIAGILSFMAMVQHGTGAPKK